MAKKPTYEELEQRVKELKKEAAKHKNTKKMMRRQAHALGERVKELDCLYSISHLVEKPDISLEEILQETIDLIPPSWQYPEITCARLIFQGQTFTTNKFNETVWKQASDIMVHGERIGAFEVFYLEERPGSDEGPFLKEERSLIDAVAERSGRIIEYKWAEEALRESEENYRNLADSIADVFFAMDGDFKYTYWNKASERLTGLSAKDAIGKQILEIFPDNEETKRALEVYQEVLRTQRPQSLVNEYHLGGKKYFFEINAYPSPDGLSIFVKDVTERKRVDQTLKEKEKELEAKNKNLAEFNTALKVLLKKRNEDRIELEEKVISNVKELIFPYMEKLKKRPLDDSQMGLLSIIESNFDEIISP